MRSDSIHQANLQPILARMTVGMTTFVIEPARIWLEMAERRQLRRIRMWEREGVKLCTTGDSNESN